MQESAQQLIRECSSRSQAGTIGFGELVGKLTGAGVESYLADYRAALTSYYMPDGSHLALPLEVPALPIADGFDAAAVQAAIRGAQSGAVKYPEFQRLTRAAGCIGYMVWIRGRHVSYFGREGQVHVEKFPD